MHPITSTVTVDTSLGPLVVRRSGSGEPALLWHSLFVDSSTFAPLAERLGQDRELILVDGPGHGDSVGPRRLYSLDDCATAAAEILDALDLFEQVDWVGNAWGGHVGTLFAHRFPDRCRSLLTISTPAYTLSGADRLKSAALVHLYRLLGPKPFRRLVSDALVGKGTSTTAPSAVATVQEAFSKGSKRDKYWAMQSVMLHRADLRPVLREVSTPTLILVGRDDPMNDAEIAEQTAHSMPDASFAAVPGAGHVAPLLTASGDVTSHILKFWQETRSRRSA